jgi:4-hydroxyacetophenone monooxygenase
VRFHIEPEPITDDDETIRAGVIDAPVPPLLASIAHLTGDFSILRDDLRPDLSLVLLPDGGYRPEQLAQARELAADALIRHRDRGSKPAPPLDENTLQRLVEFVAGGPAEDREHLVLLEEELALDGVDLRAPSWTKADLAPDREFNVAIIGAGMSGIAVAHRLEQAGVPFDVFEKNADVGGTWFENAYPGCRVDIQNHFYSYSFAQTSDWPQFHSTQGVLLDYFRRCVDEFGLRERIRFGTEVVEAAWSDDEQRWHLLVRRPDGTTHTHAANALVSATGQLNRPLMPDIPGIDRFAGPSFHSARWDHEVDLTGKRVAIIGTGASAAQFIPLVAEDAAHLTIYQRTPPWLLPVPTYQRDLPDGLRWLLRHVPDYARWDRLWIFARTQEGLLPMATVDPEWEDQARSVSPLNDMMRENLTRYYEAVIPDDELRAKVLPTYPPISKRVVLDDGTSAAARRRQPRHVRHRRDHRAGCAHERRRRARVRRDHLRHRLPSVEVPDADEGHRRPRHRSARTLGRRRARLPRHRGARVPQPVPDVRAEHQHRHQRQHHLLLGVRGALHPRERSHAPRHGQAVDGLPP